MGSKQKTHTTTQEQQQQTRLPSWLEPAMQQGVGRAEGIYNQPPVMRSYTPFSGQTERGMGMLEQAASAGSGIQPAMQNFENVLGGNYLFGGDGFNAALTAAQNRIIPQVQSMYSRGGRTNSGLAQIGMTQALGDSFAGLYDNERARQMQALGMAPQMADMAYQPGRVVTGIGQMKDAKNLADADIENYNLNAPARSLDEYLMRIQGIAPHAGGMTTSTGTSTRPIYQNNTNALLGGLASGAGLLFGGAPFGGTGTGLWGMLKP